MKARQMAGFSILSVRSSTIFLFVRSNPFPFNSAFFTPLVYILSKILNVDTALRFL
ncbi:hypothetical protein CWT02_3438 [Salmonella enterica subsp. enterica serovar Cubana]|nr:hypothetical protein CWT02_3438 [Salmonella enterica subsp. enterica serovar Cubana]